MNLGSQEKGLKVGLVGQISQMKLRKIKQNYLSKHILEMLKVQMDLVQQFITKLLQHPLQKIVKMLS